MPTPPETDPLAELFPGYTDDDWARMTRQHLPPAIPHQDSNQQFRAGEGVQTPPPGGIEDQATLETPPVGGEEPEPEGLEGIAEPPEEPTPPTGDDGSPPAQPPEFVQIGEEQVPYSQLLAYHQFDQLIRQRPDIAQLIVERLNPPVGGVRGGPSQPGAGEAVEGGSDTTLTPPPDMDLDDPTIKFLWNQLQTSQQQIKQLSDGVQQTATLTQHQMRAQQEAIVDRAQKMFGERRSLEPKDLQRVADVAARMGVLPALLQPFDPITGAPRQVDPIKAVDEALELAYYAIPEYRNRDYARMRQDHLQEQKRKQQASALSGSSGSTPRTQPAPRNEQERRQAMTAEVAQMMDGTWSGGE